MELLESKLNSPFVGGKIIFSTPPKLPENYYDRIWSRLENHIDSIFQVGDTQGQPNNFSKQISSRDAANLCKVGRAEDLCQQVISKITSLIIQKIDGLQTQHQSLDHLDDLVLLKDFWIAFCTQMQALRDIFLYLERSHMARSEDESKSSLWRIGLAILRDQLKADLKDKLTVGVLGLIKLDRQESASLHRELIAKLIHIMLALNFYKGDFEEAFLNETDQFYALESQQQIQALTLSDYLKYVESTLQKEGERVSDCLDISTKDKLILFLDKNIILDRADKLLGSGELEKMISERRVEDLRRFFQMMQRVKLEDAMRGIWVKFLKQEGLKVVSDETKDEILVKKTFKNVENIIEFKRQAEDLIERVFTERTHLVLFKSTIKEAFEYFINVNSNVQAEHLAKFLDFNLKKQSGQTGLTDVHLEQLITIVLQLFRFVNSKDVFEEFYSRGLCRRLLLKKSASYEAEKSMIVKLKTECGDTFVQKTEAMMSDLQVSEAFMQEYKKIRGEKELTDLSEGIETNFLVLSQGTWPISAPIKASIPTLMKDIQENFEQYYTVKHSGRKLFWCLQMGTCVLNATFSPNVMRILDLSCAQALMLLCFNNQERLTFAELRELTGFEDDELTKNIHSLTLMDQKVLALDRQPEKDADGKSKRINQILPETDVLRVNEAYRPRLKRIAINQIQRKETKQETEVVHERVLHDRKFLIDAAVVRTMKARLRVNYTDLVQEVMRIIRFPLDMGILKQRVEMLIENDYMKRTGNQNEFEYIA